MKTMPAFVRLLLASSALIVPGAASAQTGDTAQTGGAVVPGTAPDATADQPQTDISIPGADIVVTGRRNANIERDTDQVVSVLSTEDIARTGEGDIAGSLSHVSGLSVVGNGYVYVRGLGDRYSLSLLNGLPLPSPEPLKRVVPLDIFPTSVISSALVQKSYSPNFPGEFGGGVINLTTIAAPEKSFLSIDGGVGVNSVTTGQLGYTYFGSPSDWTGFDNGQRDTPPALQAFLNSGDQIGSYADEQDVAKQLVLPRMAVVQRNTDIPVDWSGNITGGTSFDLGGSRLGIIASAGYSNEWRTRDTLNQTADSADLSTLRTNYERVITDNHVVVNGLFGMGLEFGRNKIRWTNLYIRDTLKDTRLAQGDNSYNNYHSIIQDTAWYERQLIDTQLVGEFKFDPVDVDIRFGYANSKRRSPYETSFTYTRVDAPLSEPDKQSCYTDYQDGCGYVGLYANVLDNQSGSASVAFSRLNENLWFGGVDFTVDAGPDLKFVSGVSYTDTRRTSTRRDFGFTLQNRTADGFGFNIANPGPVSLFRPDYLLEPTVIEYYDVRLVERDPGSAGFGASLTNMAAYLQGKWDVSDTVHVDLGVRYETAKQTTAPLDVFTVPIASTQGNKIDRDYWLPAATVTWSFAPDMQFRLSGSKTIARPQFRELLYQRYYDPATNRTYTGNPYLTDSQLYNAEARYEWYFASGQHISLAGFYKRLEHPIEQYLYTDGNSYFSSFANAPKADLYGAEIDVTKYFDLSALSDTGFFAARRIRLNANYTYTHSRVKVTAGDMTYNNTGAYIPSTNLFRDDRPLTGQSDHVANLEFGMESRDGLSQQSFILNYASKRLTARGPLPQPDIFEYPGFTLDFVARQGIRIAGIELKAKVAVRNITGNIYKEYQQSDDNRVYWNRYRQGTSAKFTLGLDF
ncbi:TonB-dependent receptor [Stakelama sediminis]|uniref:Outer membrane receptor protein involved in Fe transport n=1 Tax=Stakelama sediminis TaxID=463200 RepID=A0A840YXM2_9SPHN|nr:TonB-dependent receptor [Stakelama sediminis]MBB5718297.1 outer membrane receptor protein involved in Fe transport [Stakelama sediminis]